MSQLTVVFVPGLRDHVADHWQTLLQARLPGSVCVPRLGKDNLRLADWVAALEKTVASVSGPIVLVAHSAGVMMVAHWAAKYGRMVQGALLAAPPDFESPLPFGYPTSEQLAQGGWLPTPRVPLPFPSIVAASTNDPLGRFERVAELAAEWESRLVDVGAVGHLNPASGYGEWPRALELVGELGGSSAFAR